MTGLTTSSLAEAARTAATNAAAASGVHVRELHGLADLTLMCELFNEIWRTEPEAGPSIGTEWLMALSHAGNYFGGAFAGSELVGASMGFFAAPLGDALHSHITGVSPTSRARNVGFALKLHQRAWALDRGITRITWTFDPLVRRNAYFNIAKLGALPHEYHPDFYGPMPDAINAGEATDRILVNWSLGAERVIAASAGHRLEAEETGAEALGIDEHGRPRPGRADGPVVLVAVPADIERLRVLDPAIAREWRPAVRDALDGLLASGAAVTGFTRSGRYVVTVVNTEEP